MYTRRFKKLGFCGNEFYSHVLYTKIRIQSLSCVTFFNVTYYMRTQPWCLWTLTNLEFEQFLHFSFFEKYFKTFFFLFFCKLATYIKNTANIKYVSINKKGQWWLQFSNTASLHTMYRNIFNILYFSYSVGFIHKIF